MWRAKYDVSDNPFPDWVIRLDADFLVLQSEER